MKFIKILALVLLLLKSWSFISQNKVNIKLKINLLPVENRKGRLKKCRVKIYRNNIELQNYILSSNKIKKKLTTRGIYKIMFSKDSYVSKHLIIDAVNVPNKKKKQFLKADITLFHNTKNDDVGFLETEPISIAYYDYVTKQIRWDFEYYRATVEKIIKAQISN